MEGKSVVLGFLFLFLFAGCVWQDEIVCNKPYIRVADTCCLDENDNGICDFDETTVTSTILTTTMLSATRPVEGYSFAFCAIIPLRHGSPDAGTLEVSYISDMDAIFTNVSSNIEGDIQFFGPVELGAVGFVRHTGLSVCSGGADDYDVVVEVNYTNRVTGLMHSCKGRIWGSCYFGGDDAATTVLTTVMTTTAPTVTTIRNDGRVLFYGANNQYSVYGEYSEFRMALEDAGYVVEAMELELTSEVLGARKPDVLVIAGLNAQLTSEELSVIFKFVMHDGNGLLIMPPVGRKKASVDASNTLATTFGMTLDSAVLENDAKPVVKSGVLEADNTHFVLKSSSFNRGDNMVRLIHQGVNALAFFGGYGISIMEGSDAKYVVRADYETHSPESKIFTKGSMPPVVVASRVGNGLVIVASSAEMFTDDHVDTTQYKYDNLRFGINMIDWLKSSAL